MSDIVDGASGAMMAVGEQSTSEAQEEAQLYSPPQGCVGRAHKHVTKFHLRVCSAVRSARRSYRRVCWRMPQSIVYQGD